MDTREELRASSTLDLFDYIKWKDEDPEVAKMAFEEFCMKFHEVAYKKALYYCFKYKMPDTAADLIVQCAFNKVWSCNSYEHSKSKAKSVDSGVKIWLGSIIYSQTMEYVGKDICYQPDEESDLSLMYSIEDVVSHREEYSKQNLLDGLLIVDKALSSLSEKHKVIYLTTIVYRVNRKNVPSTINQRLQSELNLSEGSIRKYRKDATDTIKAYLEDYGKN
ncbi:MAG: hypothetical protein JEZ14_11970 [Marinilabiliaceae bacterium]|nr:hypothetical protein [Marinilabiliaceae bacterium]